MIARVFLIDDIVRYDPTILKTLRVTLPDNFDALALDLDWQFVPIALLQYCWAAYVLDITRAIFSRIDRTAGMIATSIVMVAMVFVGLVSTIFNPDYWLVWIAVVGLAVGLKFGLVGIEMKLTLGSFSRFGLIGGYTLINAAIVLYVGWLLFVGLPWDAYDSSAGAWRALWGLAIFEPPAEHLRVYYVAVPLLLYCAYMYAAHARTDRAVEFVGYYARAATGLPTYGVRKYPH
jgi:hypothetical protein